MSNRRKGATKHCVFGGCLSDSRYGPHVEFINFPKACLPVRKKIIAGDKKHIKECPLCTTCSRWIYLCKRRDRELNILDIKKHTYICRKHFVFEGPCKLYPEPLPEAQVLKIRKSYKLRNKVIPNVKNAVFLDERNCGLKSDSAIEESVQDVQVKDEPVDHEDYDPLDFESKEYIMAEGDFSEYCKAAIKLEPNRTEFQDNFSQIQFSNDKCVQTEDSWEDVSVLKAENESLRKEIISLKDKIIRMVQQTQKNGKSQKELAVIFVKV